MPAPGVVHGVGNGVEDGGRVLCGKVEACLEMGGDVLKSCLD